jgi:DNA-binding PadR family transcriptional regulator
MPFHLLQGHLDRLLLAVMAVAPEGSLYPALHRLERPGLVESAWSRDGGRRRRVYQLTAAGRRAIDDGRREWRTFSAAVDRVLG